MTSPTSTLDRESRTQEGLDHWIGGERVPPGDGRYLPAVDPATGHATVGVAAGTLRDVEQAVEAAKGAAAGWRRYPSADRGRIMISLAQAIRAQRDRFVDLERADTGKTLASARAEVENSAQYFEFYGGLVNLPIGDVLDVAPDQHVFTRREPYGVIGVITPWNLPLNQAARAIAPALVAGNVVVAKPAETTSRTTVELARLASATGFPPGVLNVVLGEGDVVGTAIVSHDAVRKVAFTGSVAVGRSIGRIAADRIIPLTLELGGKSSNIVFEDADLDFAAGEAVRAFTLNAGQVCSAGTRLLVQRSIYNQFVDAVAAATRALNPGDNFGPMITRSQFLRVQEYFDVARNEGARKLVGGSVAKVEGQEGGFYIEPTVYADVDNGMRIAREEIFGPVLVAIPFDTEEDAIRIANDSPYGLIASVWSRDISRALRVADAIEAGQVFVNVWNTLSVQTPFGGHKQSGYGREKGIEAISHYSHLKTVVVKIASPLSNLPSN
ncbi:aldehyde dehydrogenase family protein [Aminobacter sp. MSH1]|uniref:aldehyde dehydrogenase family protein n=1 Tax=Aminobacter sp. MSH1 TaxID=374606 RepID=UPI000D34C9C2|nr:aldehyde dehydrogenase family protein [Aminobacter sp. MSH1]